MSPGLLLIRADASSSMGTGHLMRCLALAQEWHDRGGPVLLCTGCKISALLTRFKEEGVEIETLSAGLGSLREAQQIANLAGDRNAGWIVLDGYQFSDEYQIKLKQRNIRLLLIDDNGHAGRYCSDLVLDQNLTASEQNYRDRGSQTRLLLGTKYALLRREFRKAKLRRHAKSPKNILITMGGSDPKNVTRKIIRALSSISDDLEIRVVVGSANRFAATLRRQAAHLKVKLEDGHNVAHLMSWADLAISAAGTTLLELAFMGVPAMMVELAEHQRPIAAAFERRGVGIRLGWHENLEDKVLQSALTKLLTNPRRLSNMRSQGRALVEGRGVERVVNAMLEQR